MRLNIGFGLIVILVVFLSCIFGIIWNNLNVIEYKYGLIK